MILEGSKDYYEVLFEKNSMITLLINPKTADIIDANSAALSFYGYSKDEITNKKITDINILTEEEVFQEMNQAKVENRNYFEFAHQLADGSIREVEVYSKPIIINSQEFLYSFIHDITEQKRLEEEIEEHERKYKVLFENTGTTICIIENDTTISLVNQQAEVLTGYSKEEIEGRMNFQEFIAYEDEFNKMLNYHQMREKNNEEIPNRYEFHLKTKSGEIKNVLIEVKMISETKQSIISLVDITSNKKQQQELKQAYKKLSENIKKASRLHQHFLPGKFPDIDDLSFASYYQPAEELGGDFYNLKQIENILLFYMADVSGHGLDGAMLNILIRESINNMIPSIENVNSYDWLLNEEKLESLSPKRIMYSVFERYKQENFPEDYFLCLQIGILDLESFRLNYSNAGFHILPFIIKNNGEISSLSCGGFPITNIIEKEMIEFNEKNYKLLTGEKLILTTDGLIEQMVNGQMYGEERLKNIMKKYYYLPSEMLLEVIKADFERFNTGVDSQDDITILIVEREPNEKLVETISNLNSMYIVEDEIREFLSSYIKPPSQLINSLHYLLVSTIEFEKDSESKLELKVVVSITNSYIRIIVENSKEGFNWAMKLNEVLDKKLDIDKVDLSIKAFYDQINYNKLGNQICLTKFF